MSDAAGAGNPALLPTQDRFATELRGFGPLGIRARHCWRHHSAQYWFWRGPGCRAPHGARSATTAQKLEEALSLKPRQCSTLDEVNRCRFSGPTHQAYHFLAGNPAALPAAVWTMIVVAGFVATVFRGYMFERLGKLLERAWSPGS